MPAEPETGLIVNDVCDRPADLAGVTGLEPVQTHGHVGFKMATASATGAYTASVSVDEGLPFSCAVPAAPCVRPSARPESSSVSCAVAGHSCELGLGLCEAPA